MKILLAIDCYPPPLVGGRDLQVQMLARELFGRGHDVEVVALAAPEGSRSTMDGPIPVHRISGAWSRAFNRFSADPRRAYHPTVPDPGVVRALADLIRQRPPQIVHVHSWMLASLLPLLPSAQTRLVMTMHEYGAVCPKATFVRNDGVCDGPAFLKCVACAKDQYGAPKATAITAGLTLLRPLRGRVDRYTAVSSAVAAACAPLIRGSGQTIEVIPPFLPDANYELEIGPRPAFVPEGDYVMFAGALAPHKGLDVLLEAHAKLPSGTQLVLAGIRHPDTPARMPDGVFVAENVPHDDVLRGFAHCAVAVVPSRWPEPFGLVALEAMIGGRPVVASAVGGLQDLVVHDETGLLVAPGDADALARAISQLLADPERRERMGRAGRDRAAGYSASAVLPRIEKVYDDVISAPPPPVLARKQPWRK